MMPLGRKYKGYTIVEESTKVRTDQDGPVRVTGGCSVYRGSSPATQKTFRNVAHAESWIDEQVNAEKQS